MALNFKMNKQSEFNDRACVSSCELYKTETYGFVQNNINIKRDQSILQPTVTRVMSLVIGNVKWATKSLAISFSK